MTIYELGKLEDFPENKPSKASTACRDLVVVRRGGEAFILDHDCQHLGAPLSEGYVDGDTLVCPWHRAVISLMDGTLEEPPGCRHHRRYEALIEDGRLKVAIDPAEEAYREVTFSKPEGTAEAGLENVLILGGGAAGVSAAQTLAEEGFAGRITVLSFENEEPYDRTKISKELMTEKGVMEGGALDCLEHGELDFRQCRAEAIDLERREVRLENGETLTADAMILAPGSEPIRPDVPGADLPGVLTLRSIDDAGHLSRLVDDAKKAVVVGSGFIGLEAATLLRGEDLEVVLVSRDELPFEKMLGERVGQRLFREQREKGVDIRAGAELERLIGKGKVSGVVLENGETIEADLVIMATGVRPRTELLPQELRADDGGVSVGENFQLEGYDRVHAAGDIARIATPFGEIRVEHWRWAQQTGRAAAMALLGKPPAIDRRVPFFWTKQHAPGSYVYVGHAEGWDTVRYEGDPDGGEFIAYYLDGDVCHAVFAQGLTDRVSAIERLMAAHGPLAKERLQIS